MTDGELFDLFVAHGVTKKEIAKMQVGTIAKQVKEMRADDPVPELDEMSDKEIAQAILRYACS